MKALSAFLFLLGISMVFNAISNQWAFNFSDKGGKWVALDLVIAAAFFLGSLILWNVVKRRELRQLIAEHGSVSEALRYFDPSK
jgi:hypothetical protein